MSFAAFSAALALIVATADNTAVAIQIALIIAGGASGGGVISLIQSRRLAKSSDFVVLRDTWREENRRLSDKLDAAETRITVLEGKLRVSVRRAERLEEDLSIKDRRIETLERAAEGRSNGH